MPQNDFENWEKQELIDEIEQLRNRKRFGIVWEDKPEDVVEQCKRELPVLNEVAKREISTNVNSPINLLIEGDNFHALSVLNYTHRGKVDVIYIDPPYNTGAKDWKYNNHYVDENDAYRHSKWLSMMYNRLKIARKLLKKNGVLIITIDDYELPRITMLMDDMGATSLGRVCVNIKPEGRRQSKYIMEAHEYVLFFSWGTPTMRGLDIDFGLDFPEKDDVSPFRWEGFMRRDAGREDRGSAYWYPFYVDNEMNISLTKSKGFQEVLPINTKGIERVWLWDKDRADANLSELKAKKTRKRIAIYYKRRKEGRVKPTSFWHGSLYNANAYGTRVLTSILPDVSFDYPKSVHSVRDAIDLFLPDDGIALDYFAGSGTTGHAILLLNKNDNGKRTFILCTNNENNIATEVCYPRIQKVIKGYIKGKKSISGLEGNLKYFRTAFVSARPTDKNRVELTRKATEMLCLREQTFSLLEQNDSFKIFHNEEKYLGIIYDQMAIPDFKKAIINFELPVSVYIFSLSDDTFVEEFQDMNNEITLSPIPEAILRVYRRIFK